MLKIDMHSKLFIPTRAYMENKVLHRSRMPMLRLRKDPKNKYFTTKGTPTSILRVYQL